MSLRVSIEPVAAPVKGKGLGGLSSVDATEALGPGVESAAASSELAETKPAVATGLTLGDIAFAIGFALLAGYLFRSTSKE